jgi:hypothetical protein
MLEALFSSPPIHSVLYLLRFHLPGGLQYSTMKLFYSTRGFHRGVIILRGGVLLYTMNPWQITNKRRGEWSYHTPIRALFSTTI